MSDDAEDLRARLDAALALVPPGTVWRHLASGNLYEATAVALDVDTLAPVVVYRRLATGVVFCRPLSEWLGPGRDGRPRFAREGGAG